MNAKLTAAVAGRAAVRRAIAEALGGAEVDVVAQALDIDGIARADVEPDLIVVDVDPRSRRAVSAARRAFPGATVIAVTNDDLQELRAVLAENPDGIVVRDELARRLGVTVAAARAGQVTVPRELRTALVKPSLSAREKQVMGMVVMGFTNGEIARKLVVAESTVKSHLSSAFSKLGVRSRSEATALILDSSSGLGPGILAISGGGESNGA
jgi:DNA-binding NarL/FixJ family response regulator